MSLREYYAWARKNTCGPSFTTSFRGHYAYIRKNTYVHTVPLLKEVIKWIYEVKMIKRIRPKEGPNSLYFL